MVHLLSASCPSFISLNNTSQKSWVKPYGLGQSFFNPQLLSRSSFKGLVFEEKKSRRSCAFRAAVVPITQQAPPETSTDNSSSKPKHVMVIGGDGYYGWATALHLSKKN